MKILNKLSKNMIATISYQIVYVITTFFTRKLFIEFLSLELLGINSVYTNILSALNLAELGIGSAITSYLYKPLYDKDYEKINILMNLYKKFYNFLGIIVLISGFIISFFIFLFFPDSTITRCELQIYFIVGLLGTVSTYYLAYYRTLLIADQKNIYISFTDTSLQIVSTIMQFYFLYSYRSFFFYLLINVIRNVISNIIIRYRVKKTCRNFFNNKIEKKVYDNYYFKIKKYVKDVSIAKIGSYIYYGTDNLIISAFYGAVLTGLVSNYTLITNTIKNLITSFLNPIQATLGNLFSNNKLRSSYYDIMNTYWHFILFIGSLCSIEVLCLSTDFIALVFGGEYILSFNTVLLLSLNLFFVIILIYPSQLFVIFRLYQYDKIIIIISACMNIIISIVLGKFIGVDGVFIGTLITSLIYMVSRLYILCRCVLHLKYSNYFINILRDMVLYFVAMYICYNISSYFKVISFIDLVFKALSMFIFTILILLILLMLFTNVRKSIYNFIKKLNLN